MIFTAAHYQPGQQRVEKGTLGTVAQTKGEDRVTIQTHGPKQREVNVNTGECELIGACHTRSTSTRPKAAQSSAFVLTGGWQTDRERAYVALTRARDRTDLYVSREDLGEQGMDAGAIEHLAQAMAESHAQQASITTPAIDYEAVLRSDPENERGSRESEAAHIMYQQQQQHERHVSASHSGRSMDMMMSDS